MVGISSLTEVLGGFFGVPSDQFAFFLSQLLSIICGFALSLWLPPRKENTLRRHWFEILVGFIVLYVSYGSLIYHIALQAIPAYLMMVFLPPHIASYSVFVFSMFYLSMAHLQRMYSFEQRNQAVDITAPLMIQTQKLSSLAFNLYDGDVLRKGGKPARELHKMHAIKSRPRLVQLLSFVLSFQNSMVGPSTVFSDYICFIEGREEDQVTDENEREYVIKNKEKIRTPRTALNRQLMACLFYVGLFLYGTARFHPDFLLSDDFSRLALMRKYLWLTVYGFYLRQKFYFAWAISGASMLSAGFGFSGLKKTDWGYEPQYENAMNIHFFDIEFGTNTKMMLDAWNRATTRWLRECVYDRVPKRYAVVAVFFVSAFWHGFFPVYYLCFLSAAFITITGRLCRSHLRPYFIENYWHHRLYDILTSLCSMFIFNYLGAAFIILNYSSTLKLWGNFYFLGHLGPLLVFFLLPYLLPKPEQSKKEEVVNVYELNLSPEASKKPLLSDPAADKKKSLKTFDETEF